MRLQLSQLGMHGCVNILLSSVNASINNSVGYVRNADKFGSPDRWEAADIGGTGDCKAIALGKQIRLSAAGFETALCTVATPSGDGHCVLCVRDGNEWWVLDNLTNDILPPSSTPYKWYLTQKGKSWYYLYWLSFFGITYKVSLIKAPSPPGWEEYLQREMQSNLQSNK